MPAFADPGMPSGPLAARTRALLGGYEGEDRRVPAFSGSGEGARYAERFAGLLEEWLAQSGERTRLAVSPGMQADYGECRSCCQVMRCTDMGQVPGHLDFLTGRACAGRGKSPLKAGPAVLVGRCSACQRLYVPAWAVTDGLVQLSVHYAAAPDGAVRCSASGRLQPPDPPEAGYTTLVQVVPPLHRCRGGAELAPGCLDCLYADVTGIPQAPEDYQGWRFRFEEDGTAHAYGRMLERVTGNVPAPAVPPPARPAREQDPMLAAWCWVRRHNLLAPGGLLAATGGWVVLNHLVSGYDLAAVIGILANLLIVVSVFAVIFRHRH